MKTKKKGIYGLKVIDTKAHSQTYTQNTKQQRTKYMQAHRTIPGYRITIAE